jgi:hypothetical protein
MIKNYKDPRHQPITARKIREQEDAEARRREEEAKRPIREAEATLIETHRKLHNLEKDETLAGRPDPGWVLPQSAADLSMSLEQAQEHNGKTARQFVAETPEFYPSNKNYLALREYLVTHRIGIVTVDCWKRAFERLTAFGALEERPTAPEPLPVEQPEPIPESEPTEELTDGFDIATGEPRRYTQREIHHMSADEYKRAFKMWVTRDGDRRPRINRSMYL